MDVRLKNIGKKYEGREAFTIRNIDLEIKSQNFCVILGPSGCGKSTLLRMIAGLNSITEGELIFGDKLMNKVAAKDRDIAMVFQSYALYPHMTVYDNMAFSLKMRKEAKEVIHQRVVEAAKLLQIEEYLYSRPSDISGGQRQRVALGRAMVRKPAVFLMDEPLSNLDAKLREHMRVELVRLHKRLGTTSIYVTHDQTEAMTMADQIVLLDKGVIQQAGPPSELYQQPANVFVASFIGTPAMNLIPGKIQQGKFVSDNKLIHLQPAPQDEEKLQGHEGEAVLLGVRGERINLGLTETNNIKLSVDVVEMLGKEQILYCELADHTEIVVSAPGHLDFRSGESYDFHIQADALHFFSQASGERIN
ncbi:MAG: sn-glycerol-3-phosphate ABC transporter ATP-binding protein UgpC [Eubacteriales bacterium]|nr:sn-glycerol-3-phosphate ABC transporter ATP-binding protein UgpC [Eubacteriales bacterium]